MNARGRLFVGLCWIGVATLMGLSLEWSALPSTEALVQLFVVLLALFLAVVYLFDPAGVLSRRPFHDRGE